MKSLEKIIGRLYEELPGWAWRAGECTRSAHASVFFDDGRPHKEMLEHPKYDNQFHRGFDVDLDHADRQYTAAEALDEAITLALAAIEEIAGAA